MINSNEKIWRELRICVDANRKKIFAALMGKDNQYDAKERQALAEKLRRTALAGVTVSSIAAVLCALSLPMVYNYLQHVQSILQNEVDFCKVS